MDKKLSVFLLVLAAGCAETGGRVEMDPTRKVSEQDCSQSFDLGGGNLKCKSPETIADERQAKAKLEAEERAARERLERERAEQLALAEAARKARAAEEERLAAERRRLEEEAARKARAESERLEREAAEARARLLAEQAAREAAERERLRREKEWLEGRAQLERFVTTYGKDEQFKDVAEPISEFLDKTRNMK